MAWIAWEQRYVNPLETGMRLSLSFHSRAINQSSTNEKVRAVGSADQPEMVLTLKSSGPPLNTTTQCASTAQTLLWTKTDIYFTQKLAK